MHIFYQTLKETDLTRSLFSGFERYQKVTKCYRRIGDAWEIKDDPFIDQWSEEDYAFLITCLKRTVRTGGLVLGAFCDDVLKGFLSIEATPFGSRGQYLDLSSIHVSHDFRGRGIGTALFTRGAAWARKRGAKKLYISAHSAVETQYFYRNLGCTDAEEYSKEHVEKEPYDCQLELKL